MWNDAVDLRDFYTSSLGRVAGRIVRLHLKDMWPNVTGMDVLGIGYTTPLLGIFRPEARRVAAAMPAQQGVLHWPPNENGLTALVDEAELPFADLSQDRVILVHALECTEQVRPLLREAWRVLAEGGRMIIITPNRRGIWARLETTPFAHGQPYSTGQLSRLLRENMFTPTQSRTILYMPPTNSRMVLSSARAWESLGKRLMPAFGGLAMVECGKEIYAGEVIMERKARPDLALARPNSS